jgi:hypothetical protein
MSMWSVRLLGFALVGLSASAALADPAPTCPIKYSDLTKEQQAGEYTCHCPWPGGQIWGTGVYTADSSICRAAIHMGLIDPNHPDGDVTVKSAPGCTTYASTEGPGVTSMAYGKFDASFYFPAKGDGKCVETEVPKATMKSAALEKAVAAAYKRDYDGQVLQVVLFGWDEDLEKDDFGQVTGRDLSATVVVKLADGTCQLHYELWLQNGHGRSFSGPLSARGAGSASDTPLNCDKVAAPAPAKKPAKKK